MNKLEVVFIFHLSTRMGSPGYHRKCFVVTPALGDKMYGSTLLVVMITIERSVS